MSREPDEMSRENVTRTISVSDFFALLNISAPHGRDGGENRSLDDFVLITEEKQQKSLAEREGFELYNRDSLMW